VARILIVDDDASFRLFLSTVLLDAGHEVGYAADGDQAVSFYRKGGFDLVIIDLVMPGKHGVIAIRELKAMDHAVKIVAVSGEDAEHLALAEEAGALKTLPKPVHADDLLTTIAGMLRRATGWQGVHE